MIITVLLIQNVREVIETMSVCDTLYSVHDLANAFVVLIVGSLIFTLTSDAHTRYYLTHDFYSFNLCLDMCVF